MIAADQGVLPEATGEGAEVLPHPSTALCSVTFHLPFRPGVTFGDLENATPQQHALSPSDLCPQVKMPAALKSLRSAWTPHDFLLQAYSEDEAENLLRRLPHRVWDECVLTRARGEGKIAHLFDQTGVSWQLDDAHVSLWSAGPGLLAVQYRLAIFGDLTWIQVSELIDDAHFVIKEEDAWRVIAGESARRARERLTPQTDDTGLQFAAPQFQWSHATTCIAVGPCDDKAAARIVDTIVWDGVHSDLGQEAPSTQISVALSACCVSYSDSVLADKPVEAIKVEQALTRLVGVMTAIFSALQVNEQVVLEKIAGWRTDRRQPLGFLEKRLDRLLELQESLQGYIGGLRSVQVNLSSLDAPLWNTLSDKWNLKGPVESLQSNLELLRGLYDSSTTAVGARRTRWLGNFAFFFTLFSGVSTALSVVDFLAPDRSHRASVLTVLTAALAIIMLSAGFWVWQRARMKAGPP
jgi:hypothetical protein